MMDTRTIVLADGAIATVDVDDFDRCIDDLNLIVTPIDGTGDLADYMDHRYHAYRHEMWRLSLANVRQEYGRAQRDPNPIRRRLRMAVCEELIGAAEGPDRMALDAWNRSVAS